MPERESTRKLSREVARLLKAVETLRTKLAFELSELSRRVADIESPAFERAKTVLHGLHNEWGKAYKAHQAAMKAPQGSRSYKEQWKNIDDAHQLVTEMFASLKAANEIVDRLQKSASPAPKAKKSRSATKRRGQ